MVIESTYPLLPLHPHPHSSTTFKLAQNTMSSWFNLIIKVELTSHKITHSDVDQVIQAAFIYRDVDQGILKF